MNTKKIKDTKNPTAKETNARVGGKTSIGVTIKGSKVSRETVSKNTQNNSLKTAKDLKGHPKQSFGDALMTCALNFKIPKTKTKKDPGRPNASKAEMTDVVSSEGLSMRKFLEQEDIVPHVGHDRLLGIADREVFDSMYDRVNAIKNTSCKKEVEVTEDIEKSDIDSKGWDILKCMQTDEERKTWVQDQFKNPVPSDPSINLTNHGFRRLQRQDINSCSYGEAVNVQRENKRKPIDAEEPRTQPSKKIKLSNFGSYMKSVFFTKFRKKLGLRKASPGDVKAFKTYIGHYKGGLEETSNFLSYYNPSKVCLLLILQVCMFNEYYFRNLSRNRLKKWLILRTSFQPSACIMGRLRTFSVNCAWRGTSSANKDIQQFLGCKITHYNFNFCLLDLLS